MKKLLFGALLFLETASPATAATYYVNAAIGRDTNTGTSTTAPLLTITKAAGLTKPGDVVNIMNGTYAPLKITHSGTEAAWITYQPVPGQHPVILKNGTAWSGVDISANYIIWSRLTIQGNARSITFAQADAASTGNTTTNGHCLSVSKTSHHVKILDNVMEYCPGAGIMYIGDSGWIHGNYVHENAYWSHLAESGIVIFGSNVLSTPGKIYVDGNVVYGNQAKVCNFQAHPCRVTDGYGIIVDNNIGTNPPAGYSGRVEIFNNISYSNGGWGLAVGRSQHVDIYNNTTWHNGVCAFLPAPYTCSGGEMALRLATDVVVKNNIFYASTGLPIALGDEGENTNITWDYNVMYNARQSTPGSTPIGPHDLILDPMFTTWLMPPRAFQQQEEWQCVNPKYWNDDQLQEYLRDTTYNLTVGISATVQTASPLAAVNVLLSVAYVIAQNNPDWCAKIVGSLAEVAEAVEAIPQGTESRRIN